jgi:NitT/TauT family transport system substrate-binding protein
MNLKVGMIPILDCSQLYVAKEFEIFKKNGLNVELIPIGGGSKILQSLAANELDVAFSNLSSVVFYENNLGELINLAGGTLMNEEYTEGGLVTLDKGELNSIEDFKDKTIAVNSLNNIVHLAVVKILKKNNLDPSDVNIIEMKFSDMPLALRSNKIDVATLPEPLLTLAKQEGGIKDFGDYIVMAFGENYVTGYYTSESKLKGSEEKFERFNKSMQEATDILNKYSDSVVNTISKYTKVPANVIRQSGKPLFVKNVPDQAKARMKNWLNEESFVK